MRKIFFFPFFVLTTMSESDTDTTVTRSSITRSSVSTSHGRKKRKHNARTVAASDNDRTTPTIAGRANQSHTSYFFYKDPSNNEIAYCIIRKRNPETKAYP